MKFKTRVAMESHPSFDADVKIAPVDLGVSLRGSSRATIDSVSIAVDEIPLRLAIPFLKRRGRLQMVASIGGFNIGLSPIQLGIEDMGFQLDGMIGRKGTSAKVNGKVDCKTEMFVDGHLAGKVGTMRVELEDQE